MGEARITVDHAVDPEAATISLRNWLEGEDGLRGRVTTEEARIGEGQMGAMSDVLMVALGSGGAGAILAASLTTWIRQLRSDISVRIQRGETSIELDAARVRNESEVLKQLASLLDVPDEKNASRRD